MLSPPSAAPPENALLATWTATIRNALSGLDGTLDPALVVEPEMLAPSEREVRPG